MKPKQRLAAFNSLSREIKALRRKLGRFHSSEARKRDEKQAIARDRQFLETCRRAQLKLQDTSHFEINRQANILQDLAKIVNSGALAPDSLEFLHISSLVRKMIRKQQNKSKGL